MQGPFLFIALATTRGLKLHPTQEVYYAVLKSVRVHFAPEVMGGGFLLNIHCNYMPNGT